MKFTVKQTTIRHNGRDYAPGDVIELQEQEAAPMRRFLEPQVKEQPKPITEEKEHGTPRKSK